MEAAAMGLPVIATNIRGCRQVVADGETGLLVPARDAPALAEAIARLATQPSLRASMGAAGVAKARREFDQQTVIDSTLATYRSLLGRPPDQGFGPRSPRSGRFKLR
jgi:glycosyltransferase involved in cell wall biosynthesis